MEQGDLPHRVISPQSKDDKDLTEWTQKAFPFGFSSIDWSRVPSHHCVEWASLEELVVAFRKMTESMNHAGLVVVMWGNALCPVLEMSLGDVRQIATQIFEEHETSTDVLFFSRSDRWLIEMHHEGTLCFGKPNLSGNERVRPSN